MQPITRKIVLIVHNIRSCHNVGSLLRTAEGLGVDQVYLMGYTPYPISPNDTRLPHLRQKIQKQIEKTALGAEKMIAWQYTPDVFLTIKDLQKVGYKLIALEQAPTSIALPTWLPVEKIALIIGTETTGVEPEILAICDDIIEIPMLGKKESFNVVQAAAMALYHCRFMLQ
jgi:23S rRNA (guanosine2251-2'-O)-methyltransferase